MKPRLAVTISAAVLTAFLIACGAPNRDVRNEGPQATDPADTSSATTAAADTDAALGETLNIDEEARVTVTEVDTSVESDNQFDEPRYGGYASAAVEVEALESMLVTVTDFKLIAKDGTAYKSMLFVYGFDGVLEHQTIKAGQKASGLVIFDVDPKNLGDGGQIEYDGSAYWSFK